MIDNKYIGALFGLLIGIIDYLNSLPFEDYVYIIAPFFSIISHIVKLLINSIGNISIIIIVLSWVLYGFIIQLIMERIVDTKRRITFIIIGIAVNLAFPYFINLI